MSGKFFATSFLLGASAIPITLIYNKLFEPDDTFRMTVGAKFAHTLISNSLLYYLIDVKKMPLPKNSIHRIIIPTILYSIPRIGYASFSLLFCSTENTDGVTATGTKIGELLYFLATTGISPAIYATILSRKN